jgi:hypothetical protein
LNYSEYRPGARNVTGTIKVLRDAIGTRPREGARPAGLAPTLLRVVHRTLPVLYMQDGQNLFDPETSFAGEWNVDESMESLAGRASKRSSSDPEREERRLDEYSRSAIPFTAAESRARISIS